jgi:20S proteasome subunit alpha 2
LQEIDASSEYIVSSGVRPFGVSLLICGYDYDEDRPFLYQCDPSVSFCGFHCSMHDGVFSQGSYFPWKATAIGRNYINGKTFLEKRYGFI